jgi:hypothetical protein
MSAEALRFLWGMPLYTKGARGRSEYWYYLGPLMDLAAHGNVYARAGVVVEVSLVAGRVASHAILIRHLQQSERIEG